MLSRTAPKRLSLKRLLVGVEPIAMATLLALRRENPGLVVVNGYGPTETTICATFYTVPEAPEDNGRTPIGRPVANNRAYVLDAFGQPVPDGVPGELYVGGAGVALGYLGNDALTAERFVEDPFDPAGRCLYRTGDRVRYRPDGQLEFIGRTDYQIKLRGHRIEPAEVERRLLEHPDVREALVTTVANDAGAKSLVAYLVSDKPLSLGASDWYARLQPQLPGYMIPSAYVSLRAFPQTRNGKIDRRALPLPDEDAEAGAYVAPRSPQESAIAAIWCEVLGRERVGIHDHFLDLGGDSIQALQIAARAHEAGIGFAARDVFESATVAALAAGAGAAETTRPLQDNDDGLAGAAARAGISDEDLDDILSEFGEGPP